MTGKDARRVFFAAALSFGVLGFSWAPARDAPYQYDDYATPVADPASQSLSAWVQALPRTLRPLTKLTFAVESSIGVTDAPSRRVLHYALWGVVAALVAALAHASGLGAAAAIALAAVWGAHPVHAETVVALAGRSALLSLAFVLGSALSLLEGRTRLALGLSLLALLARETAWAWLVACAWLAFDQKAVRARVALVGGALVFGGALALASGRMRELLAYSYGDPFALDRLGRQWAAVPAGVVRWLLAPASFSVDIDFDPHGPLRFVLIAAALAMYGIAAWLALSRARPRQVRVAALLWLSVVAPTHSVVPKLDALTARDVSTSSAALAVLLACAIGAPRTRGWWQRTRAAQVAGWLIAVAALVVLVPLTRERARLARDPVALWQDACARSSTRARPCLNLGVILAQRGQLAEARAALLSAQAKAPHDLEVRERIKAVDVLSETKKLLTEPAPHETSDDDDRREVLDDEIE